jgi:hypothetical protein
MNKIVAPHPEESIKYLTLAQVLEIARQEKGNVFEQVREPTNTYTVRPTVRA